MPLKSGKLNFLIGPVGAGKSTYARRQAVEMPAVFLDVDSAMVRLYGADQRPPQNVLAWYFERRERCRALLWDTALDVLRAGADVYLELGLVTVSEREAFFARARDEDLPFIIHLLDAPRCVRRERVLKRNASPSPHTQIVPLEFFEKASDAWQPVTDSERRAFEIADCGK